MTTIRKLALGALTMATFALSAHAQNTQTIVLGDIEDVGQGDACEANIKLPKGYEFDRLTADCQYNEGLNVVRKGKLYGFANKHGDVVIPAKYEEAHGFDDGMALIKQGGKYGYLRPDGNIAIKPQFADAWGFWEGRAKIMQNSRYGFIDKSGKIVIKPTHAETGNWFENGLVSVRQGKLWGFMDKSGKIAIAPKFDYVEDFAEGLALVGKAYGTDDAGDTLYRFGFIDKNGDVVIDIKYDLASSFINGSAFVVDGDEVYYIDKTGARTEAQAL
ncbi:hypothetical protein B0181_04335 [Moraxella caviae]|uniref:KWG Leptospira n=1 Tax=Moraxella caviae TaxID=34060 RepID=A0A1T0A668_9GAMM|nr:WG repeat-containing protein [Moraxella caviae]OOR90831.1 hypothetical protein B0181_04335 [Moraxella caviae]STZ10662.1 KWG Leptospira [Moraxella caviae]VEW10569.1 KWG Leptospira [Moraxella caviae]